MFFNVAWKNKSNPIGFTATVLVQVVVTSVAYSAVLSIKTNQLVRLGQFSVMHIITVSKARKIRSLLEML